MLVAPEAALPPLRPLIDAHAVRRPVRVVARSSPPEAAEWPELLEGVSGVLLVGSRRSTPRTALPGPFLEAGGRRVPAGWLPFTGEEALACFASAAAEVQRRPEGPFPLALLGQWDDHVRRMVPRALRILGEAGPARPFWWTADRLIRRDLLCALRVGLGAAVYFGHGRPYGWMGYHGLHTRHLVHARGAPAGAVISLTCHTANRLRVSLSFSESIPLLGLAAAAFGAVRPTRTQDNWWWAVSLCEALAAGPGASLGELVLRSCPARAEEWSAYRILGDPLAVLRGAEGAEESCRRVWAPGPDDSPVPPGYLSGAAAVS